MSFNPRGIFTLCYPTIQDNAIVIHGLISTAVLSSSSKLRGGGGGGGGIFNSYWVISQGFK